MKPIPYGRHSIDEDDVNSVCSVLGTDWLTTGPKVKQFEQAFAEYVGAKHAVAVSSGTAALHLAALAAGVGDGDEVITTPMTFAATANCILYCGGKPRFADIKGNGMINPQNVNPDERTKAIIPVDYSGAPADLEEIKEIADKNDCLIIEDASHALGSAYKGHRTGSCRYSDMSVFSFHPVKHITTGEGGIITTNSEKFNQDLKELRCHGATYGTRKDEPWYYEIRKLGYNYRITDFQCALGMTQLSRIDEFIKKRQKIARTYDETITNPFVEKPTQDPNRTNSYHLYVIKLKDSSERSQMFEHLRKNKVNAQVHYIPVHWHPIYQDLGYDKKLCPNANDFYSRILSIPMYPGLKRREQEHVINVINEFKVAQ